MLQLERGKTYHMYNRGNNGENIFLEMRNYKLFLRLYMRHVVPVADTYAYSLLKNHFHIALRFKDKSELCKDLNDSLKEPSQSLSNFFNAYTKSINRAYGRSGSLFEKPFRRKVVLNKKYLKQLIVYIHQNPQMHGFVDDYRDWPYTSYMAVMTEKQTQVDRETVRDLFGNTVDIALAHKSLLELNNIPF